jgi:ADP-dependent NAD(P)H-hydrate dehydratase / NAD(P)H-hydrate epimerase
MEYFEKVEQNKEDLTWNIPEQKQGSANVIGGNSQNFCTEVKIAEFLSHKYPLKEVRTVLPDALKSTLLTMDNLVFLSSTESGSFASKDELTSTVNAGGFSLLLGDFSKNSITEQAVTGACENAEKPLLITRDAVDLVANGNPEKILLNEQVAFFASMPQLQKLLRAVYYPKMLLLTMSLVQVAEVLHKFTLSYPVTLTTLHSGEILIAKDGKVVAVPLEKSGFSPIMIWNGELAAKIAALNLYNPNNFIEATLSAIFS